METLSETTVALLPRCDVELLGLRWAEGGRDIELQLRLPGAGPPGDRERVVVCKWATAVGVRLEVPEGRGGHPLTWDTSYDRKLDGSWLVRLDFGADGELRLRCSDIEVQEVTIRPGTPSPAKPGTIDCVTEGGAKAPP